MAENDYSGSHEEGRSGQFYSGGNSIDYAGYMAGREAGFQADMARSGSQARWGGGGGGGGIARPMDLKGRVAQLAIIFAIIGIPIGALRDTSVIGAATGFGVGAAVGIGLRLMIEAARWLLQPLLKGLGFLPAVLLGGLVGTIFGGPVLGIAAGAILFVIWMVRRR